MSYKKPKEHYENQFAPVTIPVTGKGLSGFTYWYTLIIKAAFQSGIKDGY
jgi:hypothetical protein